MYSIYRQRNTHSLLFRAKENPLRLEKPEGMKDYRFESSCKRATLWAVAG